MTSHPGVSSVPTSGARQPAVPSPKAHAGKNWPTSAPAQPSSTRTRNKPKQQRQGSNMLAIILISIGVLIVLSVIVAAGVSLLYTGGSGKGNVAVIPIEGMIMSESGSASLFAMPSMSSDDVIRFIESAEDDPSIDAIVFKINSPGGTAVASEELARAIRDVEKPTVAFIRDSGTSGAYWAASATDWIIANRMSITGSIGVYASQLEFAGLMEIYNVTYRRLVAGELKDMGTPYREMTPEEKVILQAKLDRMHQYFIEQVALNRGLTIQELEGLATGMFYLGEEGVENGLIDEVGGEEEVSAHLRVVLEVDSVQYIEYRNVPSFFESLGTFFSGILPTLGRDSYTKSPEILLT